MQKQSMNPKATRYTFSSSLVSKIVLPTVVLAVVVLVAALLLFNVISKDIVEKQIQKDGRSFVQSFVIAVEGNTDLPNVRRVLSALSANSSVNRMSLFDLNTGNIVADNFQQYHNTLINDSIELSSIQFIESKDRVTSRFSENDKRRNYISLNQIQLVDWNSNRLRPYGLYLDYSVEDELIAVENDLIQIIQVFTLGMALIVFSTIFILRRTLIRPLNLINKAVKSHQRKTIPTAIIHKTEDELGQLIASYNNLIQNMSNESIKLVDARKSAEQATQAKSEFLATMSHELRTPLNGILGMLNLLNKKEFSQEQTRKLNIIQHSADSLLAIINDILDFSKAEAGKIELEKINIDIVQELGELAETFALRAEEKNIELVLETHLVKHPGLIGDPGRVRQIITNLVGNAIKFTENGNILISVQTRRSTLNTVSLTIEVSDTGIGIPEDKIEFLFSSFSQVDASTTRKFGGSGLGLAIARNLASLMDGDITVDSVLGQGSSFLVELKLEESNVRTRSPLAEKLNHYNVLVADPNTNSLNATINQLRAFGARASGVTSVKDLFEHLKEHIDNPHHKPINVVFINWSFDEQCCSEIVKTLRTIPDYDTINFVAMTPLSAHEKISEFIGLRVSASLPKPIIVADLAHAFDNIKAGRYVDDERATEQFSESKSPSLNWAESTRLLLVEDNQINQVVAEGILSDIGLVPDIASNGIEALNTLESTSQTDAYSIILMDCQMPEMDGYEATRHIRNGEAGTLHQNIPIIAMTANAMAGDKERCLAAGMSDYVSKPIDSKKLEQTLAKWLKPSQHANKIQGSSFTDLAANVKHPQPQDDQSFHWDVTEALTRFRNKPDRLARLTISFLKEVPRQFQSFDAAFRQLDYQQLTLIAHTLKGIAANLSAKALMESAKELELAASNGNNELITIRLPILKSRYEQLKPIMQEFIDEHGENRSTA